VAFEGIVLIAGGLRIFIRLHLEGGLNSDDYLMIAALVRNARTFNCSTNKYIDFINSVCLHGSTEYVVTHIFLTLPRISNFHAAAVYGFGLNIWDIKPDDLTMALRVSSLDSPRARNV